MLKLNRFFFDQAISIDNALTTNQIIHQIIKQVKEVVDYVNSLETDAHEYTDAKVLELKTLLEHQISDLETYLKGYTDTKLVEGKDYTDSEIANLRLNYIDVKVSEIYATITSLGSRLNAKIDLVDATLTNLIQETKDYILDMIKGGGVVYSAVTGLPVNADTAIKELCAQIYNNTGLNWYLFNKYFSEYDFVKFHNLPTYSVVADSGTNTKYFVFDYVYSNIYSNNVVSFGTPTNDVKIIISKNFGASIDAIQLNNNIIDTNKVDIDNSNHVYSLDMNDADFTRYFNRVDLLVNNGIIYSYYVVANNNNRPKFTYGCLDYINTHTFANYRIYYKNMMFFANYFYTGAVSLNIFNMVNDPDFYELFNEPLPVCEVTDQLLINLSKTLTQSVNYSFTTRNVPTFSNNLL